MDNELKPAMKIALAINKINPNAKFIGLMEQLQFLKKILKP